MGAVQRVVVDRQVVRLFDGDLGNVESSFIFLIDIITDPRLEYCGRSGEALVCGVFGEATRGV